MIEELIGGRTAERVLLYMQRYEEGFPREVARSFGVPFSMVYKQLLKFERAGLLVSRLQGRTRLFTWNPRFAFRKEFRAFLERVLDSLPASEIEQYFSERRRPRRTGKPR